MFLYVKFFLIVCLYSCSILSVLSFADWMTKEFCERKLVIGEIIMNQEVVLSTERTIKIFRGETQLTTGSEFILGETLIVEVTPTTGQFVFETSAGEFIGGGCNGRRIAGKPGVDIKMPNTLDESGKVLIWVGWAFGHEEVKISPAFELVFPHSQTTTSVKTQSIPNNEPSLNNNPSNQEPILNRSPTLNLGAVPSLGKFAEPSLNTKQQPRKPVRNTNETPNLNQLDQVKPPKAVPRINLHSHTRELKRRENENTRESPQEEGEGNEGKKLAQDQKENEEDPTHGESESKRESEQAEEAAGIEEKTEGEGNGEGEEKKKDGEENESKELASADSDSSVEKLEGEGEGEGEGAGDGEELSEGKKIFAGMNEGEGRKASQGRGRMNPKGKNRGRREPKSRVPKGKADKRDQKKKNKVGKGGGGGGEGKTEGRRIRTREMSDDSAHKFKTLRNNKPSPHSFVTPLFVALILLITIFLSYSLFRNRFRIWRSFLKFRGIHTHLEE